MPSTTRWLSTAMLASRYGVSQDTVRGWIERGELIALDISDQPGQGRPRWRISPEAIEQFESRRRSRPPAAPTRRRRVATRDYFAGGAKA